MPFDGVLAAIKEIHYADGENAIQRLFPPEIKAINLFLAQRRGAAVQVKLLMEANENLSPDSPFAPCFSAFLHSSVE